MVLGLGFPDGFQMDSRFQMDLMDAVAHSVATSDDECVRLISSGNTSFFASKRMLMEASQFFELSLQNGMKETGKYIMLSFAAS